MSVDKRIGAFTPIESKKVPIHEEFDETNSKHEKNGNLIQAKKAPRWKHIRGLRFFMHPFPDVYQAFGTSTPVPTITNQYMFLQEVEKKDTNSSSRKQEKNAPIN